MNGALHWKQIAALAGSCVKELDADGNVVAVNAKCVEVLEAASEDDLLGKHWTDLWPPSMWATVEEAFRKAKRGENANFAGDSSTLRGNARSWEVEITQAPPGADPDHFLVMRHDVTVHKQANEALQTLVATLARQVGAQEAEAESASHRYIDMILRLRDQQSQNKTALVTLDLLKAKLSSAEKKLGLANAAALVAESALAQAHKERVISHVIGGVAHDLNNMLASTLMSMCMIQDHMPDASPTLAKFLRYAMEGSEQAAMLSKRLMAFTRSHEIKMRELDLGEVVEDICGFVAHSLGGISHLEWMREEGAHPIIADPHLIEQAVVNLCINAHHASPDGGIIEIRLGTLVIPEQGSLSEPAGSYVTLSVTDHGTGMPPEIQSRLFEPYFTTKREGSGLGLAQVYGLMKLVNGFVRVESTLGCGTTVLLAFPAAVNSSVRADEAILDPPSA